MNVPIANFTLTLVFVSQLLVILLLVLALLWLLTRILKWVWRALLGIINLMRGDAVVKVISISISAYLFPGIVNFILFLCYRFFQFFFVEIPTELLGGMKLVAAQCKSSTVPCLWTFSENVYKTWVTLITRLFESLDTTPVPILSVLGFVSSASIVSYLLDRLFTRTSSGIVGFELGKKLYFSMRSMPSHHVNITFLIIILSIGGYLSLASIVAIPTVVTDHAIQQVDVARLNGQLIEAAFNKEQFDALFPEQMLPPTPTFETKRNDEFAIMIGNFLQSQIDLRDHLLDDWKQLRRYYFDKQSTIIKEAVVRYEIENTGRRGTRERTQHFIEIDSWFRDWRQVAESILNGCRTAIWRFDSEGPIRVATTFVSVVKSGNLATMNQDAVVEMMKSSPQIAAEARDKCETTRDSGSIPKRDDFGGYLGPFGLMSFWLLRTESPALVMITGLLGFGLLGAGCSTFIRYRRFHNLASLAGEEIGGVVIRGASAAVVVFLGVYGGLAVFAASTSAPEPNAYAVFFTCLVAAVFSEEAWNWAHERFRLSSSEGRDASQNNRRLRARGSDAAIPTDQRSSEQNTV